MKKLPFIILFICFLNQIFAQDSSPEFGLKFTGFVNSQLFFDSRQMVDAREGMVSLFPKAPVFDSYGNDINSKSSFNQLAMTSRLKANISGPNVWGANVKAVIEGDFTGVSNNDNNGFRLREAYVKLNWKKTSLLIGSYWHPLYIFEARPVTVGLNTGAPFHAFARHNQVRFEHKIGNSKIILFAGMQRDYASSGPQGRSSIYQRNASLPNFHFQYHYKQSNLLLGLGIDYKQLKPYLSIGNVFYESFSIDKSLQSISFTAFVKFEFEFITIKSQFIHGQNLSEHIMLGGYIIDYDRVHPESLNYTNVSQQSYWIDLLTKGKTIKIGCFVGYAKNKEGNMIDKEFYGMGADIDYLYRIAPRIQYHSNKFMLATEFEYTVASYFNNTNDIKGNEVGNLRILSGLFYFF